ncbi:MAG: CCA tRNA nucleotidyltransferase [Rickettsiales bacterium]|nr:CCA tRNA nucleotidyltransferase [Rickettsiales bacterium]
MRLTVATPDWMRRPLVRAVIAAFEEAQRPLRFVGGAVRDHLLGRPVFDVDAATTATPDETLALLAKHHIKAITTGLAHGTVTAVQDGATLEITTLRRDLTTDGRHAVVAFTDDWKEDAARRDFTINALYLTPQGVLYDYFHGEVDLQQGCIRFIGDAAARIAEDHLRILRYFRFLATHGLQSAEIGALAACETAALKLLTLSGERIRQEMLKLLAAPLPQPALDSMQQCGVLAVVTGHAFDLTALTPLLALESALTIAPHPLLRLALLLRQTHDAPAQAAMLSARWKLSVKQTSYVSSLVKHVPLSHLNEAVARRLVYLHGSDVGLMLILLEAAQRGMATHEFTAIWQSIKDWQPPRLPVRGEDLKQQGIGAGPILGKALRQLEERWIESDFQMTREALLALPYLHT